MYISLYRKWRPKTFDEMCGQEHITTILKKQCASGRISHAYLFCGTRGTGKTSSAKILAKAINCEHPVDGNPCNQCPSCLSIDNGSATDVLEIDAASNNKVENIRDLREEVVYPPSVLKKRVYIVDEVHMLTDSAFNALLKTLEEPPEYVVFILATTELNELPPTIISRCIRFDFSRIDAEAVTKRIEYVASQENIKLAEGSSNLIATLADGSMRDALSLLEACSNGRTDLLTKEDIRATLGLAGEETVASLLHSIYLKNVPEAIAIINEIHRSSKDISVFIDDVSVAVRDLIIAKQLQKFGKESNVPKAYKTVCEELTTEQLFYISSILEDTQTRISRYAMNKRTVLELAVIRMCDTAVSESSKALAARISELEKKLALLQATGFTPASADVPAIPVQSPEVASIKADVPEITVQSDARVPFPSMPDVCEYLADASLSAFLGNAKVYSCGSKIIISAAEFELEILKIDEEKIRNAFTAVIGQKTDVIFEADDGKSNRDDAQQSFIDELS